MEINKRPIVLLFLLIVVLVGAGWWIAQRQIDRQDAVLEASGSVEAVEVVVAPETFGRIADVFVREGELVEKGELVFVLDDTLLNAQRERAVSALEMAQARLRASRVALENAQKNLDVSQIGIEMAELQRDLELNLARFQEVPARTTAWRGENPDQFSLPVWYFDRDELLLAAEAEINAASEAFALEEANFNGLINADAHADFREVERRLAETQAAYLVAESLLAQSRAQDDQTLQNYAETVFETAEADLQAAQSTYDLFLTDQTTEDLIEAKARYTISKERYELALDRHQNMLTGSDSLRVQLAETAVMQALAHRDQAELAVKQAEANVAQAEKAVNQAQVELDLVDVQVEKLVVRAPCQGVILTQNIQSGEVVQPGAVALTIGYLDSLTITVYLPEDRYGQVNLGTHAQVRVDSYPGDVFDAIIIRIADQAEFTPRNVQTAEGRQTTVFAVELAVDNEHGRLKPGMPADVVFN